MQEDLFEPIGDKLICTPVDQEEMSSGGIYLPDVDDKKSLKAKVVAAGKGFGLVLICLSIPPSNLETQFCINDFQHKPLNTMEKSIMLFKNEM